MLCIPPWKMLRYELVQHCMYNYVYCNQAMRYPSLAKYIRPNQNQLQFETAA